MIMIRHIEGRRSERVAWLLEELGVPYELDFIGGDVPGSLLALEQHHEMRMTPIMQDGDVTMVESSAIIEYLLARYGKGSGLRPAATSSAAMRATSSERSSSSPRPTPRAAAPAARHPRARCP